VTDLIDLIERAEWAAAASRRARVRRDDVHPHLGAQLYVMHGYPVTEITLGLGVDCSVRRVGVTRTIEGDGSVYIERG